jgi:hypothetical protein
MQKLVRKGIEMTASISSITCTPNQFKSAIDIKFAREGIRGCFNLIGQKIE